MKNYITLLLISFLSLHVANLSAQEKKVSIDDFITEHNNFEINDDGEIKPLNNKEINKKIKFFIEEKFVIVDYTRNIIWDSYETFLSPYDIYHKHTFIVQVKLKDKTRLKYLKVYYNPKSEKVTTKSEWDEEEYEFLEVEKDKEPEAINS
ncbi:MAG: hypothetical protein L7S43_05455 [Flavobacteriaceae bacterium]|nr:hypothetical protein [Flavobacteriaceae bacterium]